MFHHPPDTCEKLRSPGKPTYLAAVFFSLASRSRGGEKKEGGSERGGKKEKNAAIHKQTCDRHRIGVVLNNAFVYYGLV